MSQSAAASKQYSKLGSPSGGTQAQAQTQMLPEECCSMCNPASAVQHACRSTMFRVANLCCIQEEILIKSLLDGVKGVEGVSVNVVGKYAIIKHCPISCCAPTESIMALLNDNRLGVSVRDTSGDDDEEDELLGGGGGGADEMQRMLRRCLAKPDPQVLQCLVVTCLFIAALVADLRYGGEHSPGGGDGGGAERLSMVLYVTAAVVGLAPIAFDAARKLYAHGLMDLKILMVIASLGSIVSAEYLDSALVVVLFLLAEVIEKYVKSYVSRMVEATGGGIPRRATLVGEASKPVPISSITVGDVVLVRVGDIVCADGAVIEGGGAVDESSLTGEAVPIAKKLGDTVCSGSILQSGYLHVRVTTAPEDSTMQRINSAVSEMQADKGSITRMVDAFAAVWTPLALCAAVVVAILPPLIITLSGSNSGRGKETDSSVWQQWLNRSLVLLVLACPCALVIASTIPSVCAIAVAAKSGVLIKGSSIIEKMNQVNMVALDKTGTVTKGAFKVMQVQYIEGAEPVAADGTGGDDEDEEDVMGSFDAMELAVAVEENSTHPLAAAMVQAHIGCLGSAAGQSVVTPRVKSLKVVDGVGLEGWVDVNSGAYKATRMKAFRAAEEAKGSKSSNRRRKQQKGAEEGGLPEDFRLVLVGNKRILKQNGGSVRASAAVMRQLEAFTTAHEGCVVLLVAVDDEVQLLVSLADEVKADAAAAIAAIRGRFHLCTPAAASSSSSSSSTAARAASFSAAAAASEGIDIDSVTMITGDSDSVGRAVSDAVGIPRYYAELLPEDKLQFIEYYQGRENAQAAAGEQPLDLMDMLVQLTTLRGWARCLSSCCMAVVRRPVSLLQSLNDSLVHRGGGTGSGSSRAAKRYGGVSTVDDGGDGDCDNDLRTAMLPCADDCDEDCADANGSCSKLTARGMEVGGGRGRGRGAGTSTDAGEKFRWRGLCCAGGGCGGGVSAVDDRYRGPTVPVVGGRSSISGDVSLHSVVGLGDVSLGAEEGHGHDHSHSHEHSHDHDHGHGCSHSASPKGAAVVAGASSHDHSHDHGHDHSHCGSGSDCVGDACNDDGGSRCSETSDRAPSVWHAGKQLPEGDTAGSGALRNKIMMVGDGINDAMALATAHVGVAIGANGTAVAATAGDVVVLNDTLLNIPATVRLCRLASSVILQNCFFAVGIKLLAVAFAVVGELQLWMAIVVDLGSLLVVMLNGLRCLSFDGYEHDWQALKAAGADGAPIAGEQAV